MPVSDNHYLDFDVLLPNASGATSDAPIYFLHVPKTAGSSICAFLDEVVCARHDILQADWHQIVRLSSADLDGYRFFHGHLYANFWRAYPKPLRYITFLRDPIERALSHYGHVMADPRHYFHDLAQRLGSFEAYLRHPETRATVVNFQLRALVMDTDPFVLAGALDERELAVLALERQLEVAPLDRPVTELIEIARSRLAQFCFVGITERLDASVRLLCEVFEWPLPDRLPSLNVNSGRLRREDLPEDVLRELVEANQADLVLYEQACHLFQTRYEDMRRRNRLLDAFISYAQNGEDVLLHRALASIGTGFYIDVGAQGPTGDSVTRAFYDRGWHGINIEPSRADYAALSEARPRDVNLNFAVADESGERTFFEIPSTGLATLDASVADRHKAAGFDVVVRRVPVRNLTGLCDEQQVGDIHFLKIDVEGAEKAVLSGFDLSRYRPWVVLVEATAPNSTVPTHEEWESLLTQRGYVFACFDGLNRYYVAEERGELRACFDSPPNVFDHYVRHSEWLAVQSARRCRVDASIAAASLRRAHADEMAAALQEMRELRKWAESAEEYAKSLERAMGRE